MPKYILKILLKKLDELYVLGYFKSTDDYDLVTNEIKMLNTLILNTLDVVEVVRCKDCNNSYIAEDGNRICKQDEYTGIIVTDNDYCSYGEAKDNG